MSANYCRREITVTDPSGRPYARFCMGPIATPNAFEWCDECRARLPLWPTDQAPVAHCGRGIAEAFGLDKLPASLIVVHDDPMSEASACPACGSQAPLSDDDECPDCRADTPTREALTTPDLFACRHDVSMGEHCSRCGSIESQRRGA